MKTMNEKVTMVTGAAAGIGRSICKSGCNRSIGGHQ